MSEARPAAPGGAPRVAPPIERAPRELARRTPEVVVIGGGVYGAWTALGAARRGLDTVLVEQDDFCSATSASSQRIVHGGLRYLQHGDLPRMRESIRERRTLLRAAPHLVRPLPCLVPTYGIGLQSRAALAAALAVNDLVGLDRNRGVPAPRRIPHGRLVSRQRCLELFDGFARDGLTGGAVFWDAIVLDSERLVLAVLRSAVAAGARLANHTRARRLLVREGAVCGVELEDRLDGGAPFELPARAVVSCTGPWSAATLALDGSAECERALASRFPLLKGTVLVTRPVVGEMAVALAGRPGYSDDAAWLAKGYRNYFVTPWRGRSLVGTFYEPYDGDPDELRLGPGDLARCVAEFGEVCPGAGLRPEDVHHAFVGLVPAEPSSRSADPQYAKRFTVIDHAAIGGTRGRVTVVGVKWTTARDVAARAVERVSRILGRGPARGEETASELHGGGLADPERALDAAERLAPPGVGKESLAHLLLSYGAAWSEVVAAAASRDELLRPLAPATAQIGAEVVHAVRVESARRLCDVVFRRIGLGTTGPPPREALARAAELMAGELGWDGARVARELDDVAAAYRRVGITP